MTGRVFAFFFAVFMLVTSREPPWADAHVTYDTTEALVERGDFNVTLDSGPTWFYAHRLGKKYGVFPLGNVIAMVPSYLVYKIGMALATPRPPDKPPPPGKKYIVPPPSIPERAWYAFACHFSPSLWMAIACAIFFHLLRKRGTSLRWSLLGTLALGFSTFVFVYARSPYSEALQTVLMLWMVERTLAQAESPTAAGLGWLGVACGALVNAKLVYALLLPFVAACLICAQRARLGVFLRKTPLALVLFVELVALALAHNHMKTGDYWTSGYAIKDGIFSGDLFAGLYGFFLSSGKSIFLYCPPVILGVLGAATALRQRRAETIFILAIIAATVLFNAKFRHWHADYCWGPRHLVALMPLALLLAFPWLPDAMERGRVTLRRAGLGLLLGAGLCVQLLGAAVYWDHYIRVVIAVKDETAAAGWYQEHLSHAHYIPVFSPLRGHLWMLRHMLRDDPRLNRDAPWRQVVPQPARLDDARGRWRIDWWALNWLEGPDRAPVPGALLLGTLLFASLMTGASLRNRLRRS